MNIRHFFKLVPVRVREIKRYRERVKEGRDKKRDVKKLLKMKTALEDRIIEKERMNTEGTLREAYGMECQIKIIDWILGKNVRRS